VEDCPDLFAMAVRHHQAGQLAEATRLYGEVLKFEPGHAQARHLLGLLAQQKVATQTDPKLAETHFDLGRKWATSGEHQKAIDELRKAIRLSPTQGRYRYKLGLSLQALRQLDAAVAVYRGCLDIDPAMADAWSSLGIVLSELGKVEEAIPCLLRVLELKPAYADGYFNVGVCFASIWEHAKAVEYLSKAIALRPAMGAAHLWLGKSLYVMGDIRGAIDSYRTSLRYEPATAETHWALSLAHLMLGEHTEGWKEYEWRWKWEKFPSPRRRFSQPQWNGKPLKGRTILLHVEQGFGDTLQFMRYVPLVAEAGGRAILEVPSDLHALLQGYPGVAECVRSGDAIPEFELHCPLMSLPKAFGTTLASIPEVVSPTLQLPKKPEVDSHSDRGGVPLRVGLVWAGSKGHKWNTQRSFDLKEFAPLWKVSSKVQFVSLQKGPAAAQLGEANMPVALKDGVAAAKDFADTAAIVADLDLIITVDTAVAHLAGSMKKPVWVLIPETPDWRWGLEGETTPWYPTARLFRATREDGWAELIERVARELGAQCVAAPGEPMTDAISGGPHESDSVNKVLFL
jgi:tetratricopeptide (TPR) repeat protein